MLGAVDMRAELGTFLAELAVFRKGKDLEAAAVGQDRLVPRIETMEAAGTLKDVDARTEIKMIRIAEDDLRPRVRLQFRNVYGLDGALRPDGHENRRFNHAVCRVYQAGTGVRLWVCMLYFKFHAAK